MPCWGWASTSQPRRTAGRRTCGTWRAALAAAFLNAFWPLYRAGPRSGYLDEYRRRQALTGQRVLVTPRRGTPRAAQVQGIDDECKLVVRFDGESRPAALNSGEVSVRLL